VEDEGLVTAGDAAVLGEVGGGRVIETDLSALDEGDNSLLCIS